MEPSAVEEASWGSFATTLSYEDTEMMAHLFCAPPDYEQDQHDPSLLASWFSNAAADSPYYCSAANGNTSLNGFGYDSCYLNESDSDPVLNTSPNASQIPDVSIGVSPTPPFGDLTPLNDDMSSNDAMGDSSISLSDFAVVHLDQIPKAKTVSESTGKIVPCKGGQKRTRREGSDSCSYSSEDDLKALQHLSGGRRSTNPQSVYARKRRERINERLRILQNLVPNGTKVDISTMLEEAVHYVKFLQLQIKLLSSDDLWMYAPIAYNGVNIGGLDLNNISPCHEQ